MKTRKTFSDILEEVRPRNFKSLLQKAYKANSLAKTTKGRSRKNAYSVKNQTLLFIVDKMPRYVKVKKDNREEMDDFLVVEFVETRGALHIPKETIEKLDKRRKRMGLKDS
ncbi:MAG: hypothetical protein D6735_08525 [Acidobacteria bacterium]|jgi:hypothetical protein|nr:MAG: hypothetical protein D6735_08525 [Acidobacteriota bacterium]